jgi:hypothetical protein
MNTSIAPSTPTVQLSPIGGQPLASQGVQQGNPRVGAGPSQLINFTQVVGQMVRNEVAQLQHEFASQIEQLKVQVLGNSKLLEEMLINQRLSPANQPHGKIIVYKRLKQYVLVATRDIKQWNKLLTHIRQLYPAETDQMMKKIGEFVKKKRWSWKSKLIKSIDSLLVAQERNMEIYFETDNPAMLKLLKNESLSQPEETRLIQSTNKPLHQLKFIGTQAIDLVWSPEINDERLRSFIKSSNPHIEWAKYALELFAEYLLLKKLDLPASCYEKYSDCVWYNEHHNANTIAAVEMHLSLINVIYE